jgi:outer membrane protein assembly factor BamB
MNKRMLSNPIKFVFLSLFFYLGWLSATAQEFPVWTKPFKECWTFKSDNVIGDKVASDNVRAGIILIPTYSGKLSALNIANGKLLWNVEIGGELIAKPVYKDNTFYLLIKTLLLEQSASKESSVNNVIILRSVDSMTGVTKQEKTFRQIKNEYVFEEESKILFINQDDVLNIIDLKGGNFSTIELHPIDLRDLGSKSKVNLLKRVLFVGTEDKQILLFSAIDGELLRKISILNAPRRIFVVEEGNLIWADSNGLIEFFDLVSNKPFWKKKLGGSVVDVSNGNNNLLISSLDNFVYHINKNNGNILWRRRFASKLLNKAIIKDNVIIIVPFESHIASVLNLRNGKTINSIALSDPRFFLASPIVYNDDLIFATSEGVTSFSSSPCKNK